MTHFKSYNKDFKKIYDTTLKRHYWLLGYFGGGALNASRCYLVAQDYAEAHNVPLETVDFDEVTHSSFVKGFKYCYSQVEQEWDGECEKMDSFHKFVQY